MTLTGIIFTLFASLFLFRLPRCSAPLPLLLGTSYMPLGQEILIGPFHFMVLRILVAIGFVRVIVKKEHIKGQLNALDRMMIFWGIGAICSSVFHEDFTAALINRLGMAYDGLGIYFLLRIFIQDTDTILGTCKLVILLLIPVASEMVLEAISGRNLFSFVGASMFAEIRDGKMRAQGPFSGSILAGTVGAGCLPMALLFWRSNRKLALLGLAATGGMVVTSHSSGPIMTTFFVLLGLAAWKVREHMRLIRWGIVFAIVALAFLMKAPVYYLIARIDLTGSSSGYHRAAIMEAAITHLNEWWLGGTDYTRHWMPYGIGWSEKHTDITNHYLKMGVLGGLPLMLLFIGILIAAFSLVGRALWLRKAFAAREQFLIWTMGAILFGHTATFFSVSYYDQSGVFLYLVLANVGALPAMKPRQTDIRTDVVYASPTYETDLCYHS